ncbi:MAG: C40 family peptidase [Candidatus Nomurabacteria bacterium]|nr:C40 family peptidase [Candidatus Nomurabacteria bacterium]USN88254.1 MAG: C40 family peptidase [Candidatus Nomurabacteria bacterium]
MKINILFFGEKHIFSYVPPPYIWKKSGRYEVDIYEMVDNAPLIKSYLTTMQFNVVIDGGPAPTCTLTATPSTIDPNQGETALLEWSSNYASTTVIDQDIGSVATSGSLVVSPNATTTYTANFTGQNGTSSCRVTVNVPNPVIIPLHEQAAALARQLVNHTEAYLWGGKGWDYDLGEFTTPERILSGYTYFNPDTGNKDTGIGVDCSGLITWAFNRSYNAIAGFNSNFIKYVNADGLYRDYQSSPINEAELRPGDTLIFDWEGDGYMDHVAMYVGDSGGYDVVNAGNPAVGIIGRTNNIYKLTAGFEGYRRIHQADAELTIKTGSPVDLEITDPDGNTLSAASTIPSDEEYIREIPGEMYYLELEQGHDGHPEDIVLSPIAKDGAYTIKVIPEAGAASAATYSLTVELNGVETIVANNETLDTIPTEGFTLKLATGKILGLDSTVKVLLSDLYQSVSDLNLNSTQRQKNLLSTIDSAINWFDKNRPDQIIRKLTKLQNDVDRHIANELTAEELANITKQIDDLLLLLQA